jgi:protein SCO1/2
MFSVRNIVALLFVAIAIGGGAWFFGKAIEGPGEQPRFATVLPEPRPLPEFSLTDHRNQPFTRERLRGRTSLVFFGFAHCPDICPATLQQLATARRQLAAASPAGGEVPLPEIVFISVDPERDTAETLQSYVEFFGDGITGVTGAADEIRALASPLGVFFEKQPSGEDYTVNHSTAVLVVDGNASLQAVFSAPHKVESFVHDLPLLMASR